MMNSAEPLDQAAINAGLPDPTPASRPRGAGASPTVMWPAGSMGSARKAVPPPSHFWGGGTAVAQRRWLRDAESLSGLTCGVGHRGAGHGRAAMSTVEEYQDDDRLTFSTVSPVMPLDREAAEERTSRPAGSAGYLPGDRLPTCARPVAPVFLSGGGVLSAAHRGVRGCGGGEQVPGAWLSG